MGRAGRSRLRVRIIGVVTASVGTGGGGRGGGQALRRLLRRAHGLGLGQFAASLRGGAAAASGAFLEPRVHIHLELAQLVFQLFVLVLQLLDLAIERANLVFQPVQPQRG